MAPSCHLVSWVLPLVCQRGVPCRPSATSWLGVVHAITLPSTLAALLRQSRCVVGGRRRCLQIGLGMLVVWAIVCLTRHS